VPLWSQTSPQIRSRWRHKRKPERSLWLRLPRSV